MPRLKVYAADGSSSVHELQQDEVLIGRMPKCDIKIGGSSNEVSRKHARLTRIDGDWYIEDMRSRNHTYVNHEDIRSGRPRMLRHGDRIGICSYDLLYDDGSLNSGSVSIHDSPGVDAKSSISLAVATGPNDSTRLSALLDVTQSLSNVLSLDAVLSSTLAALLRIFPSAQRAVIGFIDGDEFVPKWWQLRESSKNRDIRVCRTVIQRIANRKEAILIENAINEFPDQSSIAGLCIQSLMCAPLIDAERNVFGALQIDSETIGGFVHDDLVLMASVAIQASLAIDFTRLHEHALHQKTMEKDLELARDVQSEFLPKEPPSIPAYEFSDYYEPARFIGGDYFDYVPLANGQLAIVLADVGGKGAPAALYMARMSMETRACLSDFSDPGMVLSNLNRRLSTRFATFVMCVLDPKSHTLTIVNAGHRTPIRRRRDGALEPLGESIVSYPFSVDDAIDYEAATFEILPGESISIFSDGFEDAYNEANDDYFGIARIEAAISQAGSSASEVVDELVREVRDFSGDTTQLDDMCIVTITRTT